jgi:hypothetical protein
MPSGTVTIPSGQTSTTLTINVAGDTTLEQDEGFSVTLSNPPNNTLITTATASGTILNDENHPPTGSVTISGTPTEDQTLTASNTLADADGLGTITYHWLRGGVDTGATGSTYILGDVDVGAQISVSASYTDGHGTAEAVTSAATAAVANVNDAPTDLAISSSQVVENVAGATVGVLSVTDPDFGDTTAFTIRPGFDAALFTISANELRVGSAGLDFEAAPARTVTIRATDSTGAFFEETFTIDVIDRAEVTLTVGTDIIAPSADNTQFIGTAPTLNATDNLDSGPGTDSLVLYGSGTFDLNSLAGYSGFEEQRLVNFSNSPATLILKNGTTTSVIASGTGNTGIVLGSTAAATSIQGGDGRDDVVLQGTGTAARIEGGNGNDSVTISTAAAWNPNIIIDGGNGSDQLTFRFSGTLDLQAATISHVEHLDGASGGAGNNVTLLVDADTLTDVTSISGTVTSKLVTAGSSLDLTGKSVSGFSVQSTNATGTLFTVNDSNTA